MQGHKLRYTDVYLPPADPIATLVTLLSSRGLEASPLLNIYCNLERKTVNVCLLSQHVLLVWCLHTILHARIIQRN